MGFRKSADMFDGVLFRTKTTPQIHDAMTRKVEALRTSVGDREGRMTRIRDEYGIDAERLAVLVMRFRDENRKAVSYDNQGGDAGETLVPAGVIANLVREREMIDHERQQIRTLELILRNLADEELYHHPETGEVKSRPALHTLEDEELVYLGF